MDRFTLWKLTLFESRDGGRDKDYSPRFNIKDARKTKEWNTRNIDGPADSSQRQWATDQMGFWLAGHIRFRDQITKTRNMHPLEMGRKNNH